MNPLITDISIAGLLPLPVAQNSSKRRIDPSGKAFAAPRDFLNNQFVYLAISPRARGLCIGINLNPDRKCNFDCLYCDVNRKLPVVDPRLDIGAMAEELRRTLEFVRSGEIRSHPDFSSVPVDLLELRHVALSGNGEPTLCPIFSEVVQAILHVRARGAEFFKVVLITNATGLDLPDVRLGLQFFTRHDEVWAKLDAGSETYLHKINRTEILLESVLRNILLVGRSRPIIIQSLFALIDGQGPSDGEIHLFAQRLKDLRDRGARISLVQIYSPTRPQSNCHHLPLRFLSEIAQVVRTTTGLKAEVF